MTDPIQIVAEDLYNRFVKATKLDPRGMFFRVGDEKLRMRMLCLALAEVLAPTILEVARLREELDHASKPK